MPTADGGRAGAGSTPVDEIIAYFRAGLAELRCIGSERLVRRGVSVGHLHLMSMLDRHGEMPMSRIAEVLDISLSNATGLIDRMAERGLVERGRVPDDRRIVLVRLTPGAREILEEIEVLRNDVMLTVLARLTPAQLDRLARAAGDLRRAIDEVRAVEPEVFTHGHLPPGRHPIPQTETSPPVAITAAGSVTEGRN